MAIDALDPGPGGDFPHCPRNPDGTLDTVRMPIRPYVQNGVLIDPEPTVTLPDGRRVRISHVVPPRPQDAKYPNHTN